MYWDTEGGLSWGRVCALASVFNRKENMGKKCGRNLVCFVLLKECFREVRILVFDFLRPLLKKRSVEDHVTFFQFLLRILREIIAPLNDVVMQKVFTKTRQV